MRTKDLRYKNFTGSLFAKLMRTRFTLRTLSASLFAKLMRHKGFLVWVFKEKSPERYRTFNQ